MGTRAVVVVGIVGAVLFGLAAFLLTAGGDEPTIPAAAKSSGGNGSRPAASTPTPNQNGPVPGAASNVIAATVLPSDIEGAVVPATPVTPPYEEDLVSKGGVRFAVPLRTWAVIGDRYGVPRSEGRIHGGINFVLAQNAVQEVYSSCDGSVIAGDTDAIYGKYLVVDCGGGWLTLYGNLKEQKAPARTEAFQGETVLATTEGFLYFEIRFLRVPVNPEPYLDFSAPAAGHRRPQPDEVQDEGTPDPTATATPSSTATGTATRTATPRPGTTPVPGGGSGGGSGEEEPGGEENPPAPTDVPPTSTQVPPTRTPTPVPPTPTATSTPTPQPPTPTRTPTQRPIY